MSSLQEVMQVINTHHISNQLLESDSEKIGGLITDSHYAWFAFEATIVLYSKQLGSVVSSRSFGDHHKDKSFKITFVKDLNYGKEMCNLLLVGCSFKYSGILYVCQLPTLTTVRCIQIPNPISYISTIINKHLVEDQLCDEFKIMSTILLVGMATGAVYAVDLRQDFIENQLSKNKLVINESRPNKLFIMRKSEDCQEVKEMSDDSDCHLAMFINENFSAYCKKQYSGKLKLSISSLLYVEEINTIAIGYSTGHFQLWDCKIMRTIVLLKEPKYIMPITHINFLEPSDDPNNLCYLWIIQSDNCRLPNATMIALTYEQRIVTSNGLAYRAFKGYGVKLEMGLRRETGIGRCISTISMCNINLFRNETDMDEDCEIKLFAMMMEVRQSTDAAPESYMFLFDINQWYKAQMPSTINHLRVSNSFASFVKLPYNISYLDFNISDKTLRPFGYNFRNNVEELYYPSSIYFECECLVGTEIIKFKHAGVQQEILDQLISKSWKLLINPSLVFNQCIQTNLRPFFWDKSDDYFNYSVPDQRSFVISILVENKIMSVLSACAEEWKNGTYVSTEATILHLVQCLWKHVMVVKQYADKLCVPLFDYSGTQLDKKNERLLNHCLSQMQCVKHFLEDLHNVYGVHITNVDYSYRAYTLNLVTHYFKAVTCFLNYGLLPESLEKDPTRRILQCDFTSLVQYANKRRKEFGDSQLYLIDAIVNHEPKGNKLIEQWLHEGGEATKGMYPPSNVQCLLRIYLNAALSDQLKNFITIYFLIDVCSSQEVDVAVANRMCNFAIEFDVENQALNTFCRASWLLDHDMFEEAMEILGNKEYTLAKDNSWDWFHWTVLKLLVFKSEFFWARFYLKLVNVNIITMDDHKFYINLQIMNNQYFEALSYIRSRPSKEKQTLFEYCFDRCKEIKKLKCLIDHPWDIEEEELFFSYLKKLKDTESLVIQMLFLLQKGRYLEAIELNKSLDGVNKSKYNDDLIITSLLVSGFEKTIPKTMRQCYNRPFLKNVYKKTDVVLKCMYSDSKMFCIKNKEKEDLLKVKNIPPPSSDSDYLLLPTINNTRKRSPIHDKVPDEKRRRLNDDDILSPPKSVDELKPIGKQVLEILNTPLVEKSISSPSIANCSSILKPGSAKHKRVLSIKGNESSISRNVLRFSLPGDEDAKSKLFIPEEKMDVPKDQSNESFFCNENSKAINLSEIIVEQQETDTYELIYENNKIESSKSQITTTSDVNEPINEEPEKMDISEDYEFLDMDEQMIDSNEVSKKEINKTITPNLACKKVIEVLDISSDEEDDQEKHNPAKDFVSKNKSLSFKVEDNEFKIDVSKPNLSITQTRPIPILLDINDDESDNSMTDNPLISKSHSQQYTAQYNENLSGDQNSQWLDKNTKTNILSPHLETNSDDNDQIKTFSTEENNQINLDDESRTSAGSNTSSTSAASYSYDSSGDSELERTRYGRFKSQEKENTECVDLDDEQSELYNEEGIEEEEYEEEEYEEEEYEEEEYEEEEYEESRFESQEGENIECVDLDDEKSEQSNEEEIVEVDEEEKPIKNKEGNEQSRFESQEGENIECVDLDDEKSEQFNEKEIVEVDEEEKPIKNKEGYEQSRFESQEGGNIECVDLDDEKSEQSNEEEIVEIDDEEKPTNQYIRDDGLVLIEDKESDSECYSEEISEEEDDENSDQYDENSEQLNKGEYDQYDEDEDLIVEDVEEEEVTYIKEDEERKDESYNKEVTLGQYGASVSKVEQQNSLKHDNDSYQENADNISKMQSGDFGTSEINNFEVKLYNEVENAAKLQNCNLYEGGEENVEEQNLNSYINLDPMQYTSEKEESEDGVEIIYSNISKKSSPEYHKMNTSVLIQASQENNFSNHNVEVMEGKNYNDGIAQNSIVIDSQQFLVDQEGINDEKCEHNSGNFEELRSKSEIPNAQVEVFHETTQEYPSNENNFEMTRETCFIPEDGFNHLENTVTNLNQLDSVNQSNPFLFGESIFGQQEISENKPMFLFGHVYSVDEDQHAVNLNKEKPKDEEFSEKEHENIIDNKESKPVKIVDDMQDILELKSLPESNPEENLEVYDNCSISNNSQLVSKESSEKSNNIKQSSPTTNTYQSQNIDTTISTTNEFFSSSNKVHDKQLLQIQSEKIVCETAHASLNVVEITHVKSVEELHKYSDDKDNHLQNHLKAIDNTSETESKKISHDNVNNEKDTEATLIDSQSSKNMETQSVPQMNPGTIIEQKQIKSCDISLSKCSTSGSAYETNALECKNFNEKIDSELLKTNKELLIIEPVETHNVISEKDTSILDSAQDEQVIDSDKLEPVNTLSANISILKEKDGFETNIENKLQSESEKNTLNQSLIVDLSTKNIGVTPLKEPYIRLEKCSIPPSDKNLRRSSRAKSEQRALYHVSEESEPNTSKSDVHLELNKDNNQEKREKKSKFVPPSDTKVITTRSRAKSENLRLLETSTSDVFRPSGMTEDNNRQVRVSLSKKRSKSHENISVKRRSGRSRSLAPVEEAVVTRRTAFGLDQIPEEESSNPDKNSDKSDHSIVTRKSKFNFLSSKLTRSKRSSSISNIQQETQIRTPRRSQSVQPALTLSVKAKPKRSSSVNLVITDDKSFNEKEDFMEFMKKPLVSPKKTRKRSIAESVKSSKKQKNIPQVEQGITESESYSDGSNQNLSDTASYCEKFSPIPGDNSRHMLFTPAKPQMKIRMAALDDEENSSSDESTDSKRVMTRSMIKNTSRGKIETNDYVQNSENQPSVSTSSTKEKVKRGVSVDRQRKSISFNTSDYENSPKKTIMPTEDMDKSLASKRRVKNIKETIAPIPSDSVNEQQITSQRRMTRFQQSILDKSLQSTSIVEQDEIGVNSSATVSDKKKNLRKTKQKKSNN